MKKVFAFVAVAAAMLFAGQAYAQLSVNAGYVNKTMDWHYEYKYNNTTYTTDTNMSFGGGFFVGASYNYALSNDLNVSAGLYLNYNSTKDERSSTLGGITTERKNVTTMMDLNIPILVNYKYSLSDDLAVFAFAGPNIQFGLSANQKRTVTTSGAPIASMNGTTETTNNMYAKEDGEDDADLNRLDVGVMVGVGAQFMNFRLQAGYCMGLFDRSTYKEDSDEVFRENFNHLFIGVGYAF